MADQYNSLKRSGERGRNRTFNLLIKSQLLCQLSYAPTVGNLAGRTNKNYSIHSGFSVRVHSRIARSSCFSRATDISVAAQRARPSNIG